MFRGNHIVLGIIYLVLASFVGYNFLKKFIPMLFNVSKYKSLMGKPIKLDSWMVTLPGGFLVGILLMTWLTYIATWSVAHFFPELDKPLILGNMIAFAVFTLISVRITVRNRNDYVKFFKSAGNLDPSKFKIFINNHLLELIYIFAIFIVWSIFMFRSFYVKDGEMHIGISVFSDFGATLSLLRSFSLGSNFPTEYTHFAGGNGGMNNISYHFMFQFLSGNLEFLGMRIDWAFNVPSILSIVAFLMLLYSFTVIVIGKRWVAIIASILFFFRSSLAFFTNIKDKEASGITSLGGIISNIMKTGLSPDGANIGKTEHENWGFWAQKVYVNKRHYAFVLGIVFLALIIIYPLFRRMIYNLSHIWRKVSDRIKSEELNDEVRTLENSQVPNAIVVNTEKRSADDKYIKYYLNYWIHEFILSKDAWLPSSYLRPILLGIILGLSAFWNGAVIIAVLPVLALIAVFSKRRIEFLIIAVITVTLSLLQSKFFTNGGVTSQIGIYIGFLVPDGKLSSILKYYIELLGLLPFALAASLFFVPKGVRWLALAFISPLVMATTIKFSVDVGANHVIVIFSIILVNILVAYFLYKLFTTTNYLLGTTAMLLTGIVFVILSKMYGFNKLTVPTFIFSLLILIIVALLIVIFDLLNKSNNLRRILPIAAATILLTLFVSTGMVDAITLYNNDKASGTVYRMDDPIIKWVAENTGANDVFLINPTYSHRILMAGRKVYLGGVYFTWTAGYDSDSRAEIIRQVYSGTDSIEIKKLCKEEDIKYIVIDNGNRQATDYTLNEKLFEDNFEPVYTNPIDNTIIYKAN